MTGMRHSQASPAVVLGVPRVRASRPAPTPAPVPAPEPLPAVDVEIEVEVDVAPEPVRAPMRAAPAALPTQRHVYAPVRQSVQQDIMTPAAAFSIPTPPRSYAAPHSSQLALTPAEGVTLPPRGGARSDADAEAWLSRVARSIPTRVAEHFVTFGVATFSFAFLAAVIATFGGSDAVEKPAAASTQEPRAGYTRPYVEKLATGAPQAETNLPAPSQTLGMMQVKPPARTVTIKGVSAAAAPAEAARRAAVPVAPAPPPPSIGQAGDIPAEREPVQAAPKPKSALVVAAPAHPTSTPARREPPAAQESRPRPAPTEPKGESGLAQRALDEARGEDTSLSGH